MFRKPNYGTSKFTIFVPACNRHYILPLFFLIILAFTTVSCSSDSYGTGVEESPEEQEGGQKYKEEKASATFQFVLDSISWPAVVPSAVHTQGVKEAVLSFYQQNNYQPIWNTYKEGGQSSALLERLRNLQEEGLEPADFPVEDLRQQLEKLYDKNTFDYSKIARLDLVLSANYFLGSSVVERPH